MGSTVHSEEKSSFHVCLVIISKQLSNKFIIFFPKQPPQLFLLVHFPDQVLCPVLCMYLVYYASIKYLSKPGEYTY